MKDLIERQAAINALKKHEIELPIYAPRETDVFWDDAIDCCISEIEALPSAQPEPISEEYAKAVRTWLINYQVRCAELKGRYTPYEILGWIVSDWRKENEIW